MNIIYHETRICDVCGKEHYDGMTTDDGDLWVCEDCFQKYMDDTYGKGNWKPTEADEEDGAGGFYLVKDGDEWEGTGIYYTTWDWEEWED